MMNLEDYDKAIAEAEAAEAKQAAESAKVQAEFEKKEQELKELERKMLSSIHRPTGANKLKEAKVALQALLEAEKTAQRVNDAGQYIEAATLFRRILATVGPSIGDQGRGKLSTLIYCFDTAAEVLANGQKLNPEIPALYAANMKKNKAIATIASALETLDKAKPWRTKKQEEIQRDLMKAVGYFLGFD